MTDNKRVPRQQKVKAVKYFNGKLACQRCANTWQTVDLNPERKVTECPICGQPNDIREAIGRAA
jgi:transcription elongation factor Elf1